MRTIDGKNSAILMGYMKSGFSQQLLEKQNAIDEALIRFIEKDRKAWENNNKGNSTKRLEKQSPLKQIMSIAKLSGLRKKLGIAPRINTIPLDPLFEKILQKAGTIVSSWGGKMYFVYIPQIEGQNDDYQVLPIVQRLNIPIIDFREKISDHPDSSSLYLFGRYSLLNEMGFQLVGQAIYSHLSENLTKKK